MTMFRIILACVGAAILLSIAMGIEDWFSRRSCERKWEAAKLRRDRRYLEEAKRQSKHRLKDLKEKSNA